LLSRTQSRESDGVRIWWIPG